MASETAVVIFRTYQVGCKGVLSILPTWIFEKQETPSIKDPIQNAKLLRQNIYIYIPHDGGELLVLEVRAGSVPHGSGKIGDPPVSDVGDATPGKKRPHVLEEFHVRVPFSINEERGWGALQNIQECEKTAVRIWSNLEREGAP